MSSENHKKGKWSLTFFLSFFLLGLAFYLGGLIYLFSSWSPHFASKDRSVDFVILSFGVTMSSISATYWADHSWKPWKNDNSSSHIIIKFLRWCEELFFKVAWTLATLAWGLFTIPIVIDFFLTKHQILSFYSKYMNLDRIDSAATAILMGFTFLIGSQSLSKYRKRKRRN